MSGSCGEQIMFLKYIQITLDLVTNLVILVVCVVSQEFQITLFN